jgi:pimeloyl-ACP methyl ester carboxylesterase
MPTVVANGINIAYEECGQGDPLVLIMGLGADGTLWEEHVRSYSKHFRCILVDNRGAGRSDKPAGPYTTAMMAQDTAGLMDALGITQSRVAGISMGSAIAQQLALAFPHKVRSLVLISSWAQCDRYMKDVFEHLHRMRGVVSPEHFSQLLQLWIFTPKHYAAHYQDLVAGRALAPYSPMPDHAFAAQCAACSEHDVLVHLGKIQAPALITIGDADIFTPLRCSQAMQQRMPNAEMLVFPGFGHCHHWEDLKTFNEKTTAFLLSH